MRSDPDKARFIGLPDARREIGKVIVLVQLAGFVSAVEIGQEPVFRVGQDVGLDRGGLLRGID